MADALAKVKADLGYDAVILHTRTFKRGGLLGVGARRIVEITASKDPNVLSPIDRRAMVSRNDVESTLERPSATTIGSNDATYTPWTRRHAVTSTKLKDTSLAGQRGRAIGRHDINTFASGLRDEMNEIRQMVRELLDRPTSGSRVESVDDFLSEAPAELQAYYTRLLQNEVAEEVAREILAKAQARLAECQERIRAGVGDRINGAQIDERIQEKLQALVPAILMESIERMLPDPGPVEVDTCTVPKLVAFVGPTGVGKTTTVAKLAAHFKLRENKKVALVTIDTYRIAAVDQLRAYANIMSLPLEVVFTPDELAETIKRLSDYDLILLDTSGRSHRDVQRLDELGVFLEAARQAVACMTKASAGQSTPADRGADPPGLQADAAMEVHLLLSCTCHPDQLIEVAQKFSGLGVDRAVFTKLDEAVGLGVVLNVASRLNLRLSYLTTGQEVPDDIEVGHRRRIAEMLLKGDAEEPLSRDVLADNASAVDHVV